MSATAYPWEEGREAWARGATNGEVAEIVGVTPQAVGRHAKLNGWTRDSKVAEEKAEERRLRAEEAKVASQRAWGNRRAQEADAAGLVAGVMRQGVLEASRKEDARLLRERAIAYGIFIDKAQLLSGAATSRIGAEDPRERAQGILDELAEKRDQKKSA